MWAKKIVINGGVMRKKSGGDETGWSRENGLTESKGLSRTAGNHRTAGCGRGWWSTRQEVLGDWSSSIPAGSWVWVPLHSNDGWKPVATSLPDFCFFPPHSPSYSLHPPPTCCHACAHAVCWPCWLYQHDVTEVVPLLSIWMHLQIHRRYGV